MWNAIRALKVWIGTAILIGFGAGLVFGAVQGIVTGSETPSELANPMNTPTGTTSSCESFDLILIGVETSDGEFADVEKLVRLLREAGVDPEVRRLPWESEAISSETQDLVARARDADTTVVLLRLGTGDAQLNLATDLAETVGPSLHVLAGGAAEMTSELGGLLERTDASYRPLNSVRMASDVMTDQETTDVTRSLVDGFDCGRATPVS